jgi:tetratricopeptide (TPR) repeat protein
MAVPWDDGDQRAQALNEQAQQAMTEGRFAEGASLSRQAYNVQPTAAAAARAIHCMRKQGVREARAAVVFGRQPVEQWPAHQWLIREYVWAVYEGYLRSGADHPEEEGTTAEPDGEFPVMIKATRRILKLSQEELPQARAVFALCKEARRRGQWPVVLEFAMLLDREALSDEPHVVNGRVLPSHRQQWLSHVTRAHLELAQYDACTMFAQEGRERYPEVLFFRWWHAQAQVRRGNVAEGLRELEEIEERFTAQWYVRRDLADACERLGRDEDAWRWHCRAASLFGEMQRGASMLPRMGALLERQGHWELALDHLQLAWALAARPPGRETLTESCRQQVEAFLQRQAEALPAPAMLEGPPSPEPLLARCRAAWAEGSRGP